MTESLCEKTKTKTMPQAAIATADTTATTYYCYCYLHKEKKGLFTYLLTVHACLTAVISVMIFCVW